MWWGPGFSSLKWGLGIQPSRSSCWQNNLPCTERSACNIKPGQSNKVLQHQHNSYILPLQRTGFCSEIRFTHVIRVYIDTNSLEPSKLLSLLCPTRNRSLSISLFQQMVKKIINISPIEAKTVTNTEHVQEIVIWVIMKASYFPYLSCIRHATWIDFKQLVSTGDTATHPGVSKEETAVIKN